MEYRDYRGSGKIPSAGLFVAIALLASCSHSNTRTASVPAVRAGSATLVAARLTPHRPCSGKNYAYDGRNEACYELLGPPLARAGDVESKGLFADSPLRWSVMIALRPAAADRVDRFAVANPSGTIAVVSGSTLLDAAPLNLPPFHGRFSLDDPRWTRSDAQHLVDALGGHDITRDPGFHPAPTSPSG